MTRLSNLRPAPSILALALIGMLACDDDGSGPGDGDDSGAPTDVLYIQSNDPTADQNSVLAYRRSADGSVTPLEGSPFLTGGTGVANPEQMLGPNDLDQSLVASEDHRRLFVVNGGSNTVAVLDAAEDGTLSPVADSPFASGGVNPASIGLAGDRLYVVNAAQDPAQSLTAVPSYNGFDVDADGMLTPIPGAAATSVVGAAPSQALIAGDNSLLFGADFLAPSAPTPQGSLRAFGIGEDGSLAAAPGTPLQIPGPTAMSRMALGLIAHPTENVLYVGFPAQNMLGVYTYQDDGTLALQTAVPNSGAAICWLRTSPDGDALYTVNTGTNSVSSYSLADPLAPEEEQHLALQEPGPLFTNPAGMMVPTSQAFQIEVAPGGRHLYVISQHANPDFSAPNGNWLHVLEVATDGTLSEPIPPVQLPVATTVRPQGLVVF